MKLCVYLSYRTVLIFSLLFLWLRCNRGRLGLVPGNLQNTTFELSSLVCCLEHQRGTALLDAILEYFNYLNLLIYSIIIRRGLEEKQQD